MRFKVTFLTLMIAVLLIFSAQAECNGNKVEMSVPSGYRGVDCTYTVYVDGTEVYAGTTGGASKITVPDYGSNCSYKVVYGEAAAETATACPTAQAEAAATACPGANAEAAATACPTVQADKTACAKPTADYSGMKVSRKAKKYYSSKATQAPTATPTKAATAAPTAQPTVAPTAKPTVKPTAVLTAKPTVKPTAVLTAKPTVKPTAVPTAKPTQAPTGSNSSSLASQVASLVNEYRAQYGLGPVSVDSDLTSAACVRGKEIAVSFSHTRPDGSSWSTVSSKARGENIAMGYQNAEKVMAAWMTSEGHRANILRESFTTIGVCAYEVNGVMYWVQLFGTN